MENSRLRGATPTSVNVTVGQRSREYLTDREVERLIEATKRNRSERCIHSKAAKRWVRCDDGHSGRHGTSSQGPELISFRCALFH